MGGRGVRRQPRRRAASSRREGCGGRARNGLPRVTRALRTHAKHARTEHSFSLGPVMAAGDALPRRCARCGGETCFFKINLSEAVLLCPDQQVTAPRTNVTAVACADDAEVLYVCVLASAFGHLMTWTTWTRCVYPSQIRESCNTRPRRLSPYQQHSSRTQAAQTSWHACRGCCSNHRLRARQPCLPRTLRYGCHPMSRCRHLRSSGHLSAPPTCRTLSSHHPMGARSRARCCRQGLARGRPTLRHCPTAPMLLASWCLASEPRARPRHSHRRQCRCLVHRLGRRRDALSPT